jgi:flavin reductase (DIM6/NTAB) family NADH-FMN oxidoreductase RutF
MKIQRRPTNVLLPVPLVLVSVAGEPGGRPDIVTLAWAGTVCSAPPMLSVSVRPSRHSYGLLQRSHEFVVNVPRAAQARQVDLCGNASGRDTDKFAACDFHPAAAARVRAPMIAECPVNIECVTRHRLSLGAHDLFIGEIVAVHFDEEVLDDHGRLQVGRIDPLAYVHGEYWTLGRRVGSYGFTVGGAAVAAADESEDEGPEPPSGAVSQAGAELPQAGAGA